MNIGWFLVRYEDDGVEEWLRLPGDAFNNNARGSWRFDLDLEASGGIEGGGCCSRRRAASVPALRSRTGRNGGVAVVGRRGGPRVLRWASAPGR